MIVLLCMFILQFSINDVYVVDIYGDDTSLCRSNNQVTLCCPGTFDYSTPSKKR